MKKLFGMLVLCATIALSFSACTNDGNINSNLSHNELSLIAGQQAKLLYNGDCTWSSDEPLIAKVDENGNVTAKRVGETTIWANDEYCKVTVTPQYNTYMEPCVDWGASENEITNFMNGYEDLGKSGNIRTFKDNQREIIYMYMFTDNSLSASAIGANFISKGDEITDFLLERYVVVSVDKTDYTILMVSIDQQLAVGVSFNASSTTMLVIYMPFNENTKSTSAYPELRNQCIQNNTVESESRNINVINELIKKFDK